MTQSVALIIHEIFDAPNHWKDTGDSITNGYYTVGMDGSFYSMGAGRYTTGSAERESLSKAMSAWKEETGWRPRENIATSTSSLASYRESQTNDRRRKLYEEFTKTVRSSLKGFLVHQDSGIFSSKIQTALDVLDGALIPMDKIEGKAPDAEGSGISGS